MEQSILISTKKILGIDSAYDVYDLDIITHINSAFSILCQLGVGPVDGFMIEDDSAKWDDFLVTDNTANLVRTYIFLKTRILFDPPGTGYLVDSMQKQIDEAEWRLNVLKDVST